MSRKRVLVEHGFRLPSALGQPAAEFPGISVDAGAPSTRARTPGPQELGWSEGRVTELVVRPTGLVDPRITLKTTPGADRRLDRSSPSAGGPEGAVLVTTLTKRTAEELTDYLRDIGIHVRYLHSEIDAIERVEILRALRKGEFDVLVGHQPAPRRARSAGGFIGGHSRWADKEGYLRSNHQPHPNRGSRRRVTSTARSSFTRTRRRKAFRSSSPFRNIAVKGSSATTRSNNITPRSVSRAVEESLSSREDQAARAGAVLREAGADLDVTETIRELEQEMLAPRTICSLRRRHCCGIKSASCSA